MSIFRKFSILVGTVAFLVFSSEARAMDTVFFNAGGTFEGVVSARMDYQKSLNLQFFESPFGFFEVSLDGSLDYWKDGDQDIYALAAGPAVTYRFDADSDLFQPYAEIVGGASYITETEIAGRNLGIHFQFESVIGAGVRLGKQRKHGLGIRFIHYSNADLADANSSLNFWMLSYSYSF